MTIERHRPFHSSGTVDRILGVEKERNTRACSMPKLNTSSVRNDTTLKSSMSNISKPSSMKM